jgi:hypothetical protein
MTNLGGLFGKAMQRTDSATQSSGLVVVVSPNSIVRNSLKGLLGVYKPLGGKMAVADTLVDANHLIERFHEHTDAVAASA